MDKLGITEQVPHLSENSSQQPVETPFVEKKMAELWQINEENIRKTQSNQLKEAKGLLRKEDKTQSSEDDLSQYSEYEKYKEIFEMIVDEVLWAKLLINPILYYEAMKRGAGNNEFPEWNRIVKLLNKILTEKNIDYEIIEDENPEYGIETTEMGYFKVINKKTWETHNKITWHIWDMQKNKEQREKSQAT